MWLRSASFRNFKALANCDVALGTTTLLVGKNGSGKSSVLDGIGLLARAVNGVEPKALFEGDWSLDLVRTHDARTRLVIEVEVDDLELLRLEAILGTEGLEVHARGEPRRRDEEFGSDTEATLRESRWQRLRGARRLHLQASRLAAPSVVEGAVPSLSADGFGLATMLAWLAGNEPETRDDILRALRELLPSVKRLRTPRREILVEEEVPVTIGGSTTLVRKPRRVIADTFELEMGDGWVPAAHLSEGTLIVLGLLAALYAQPSAKIVMLDDIERGLHPSAQRRLARTLRELCESEWNGVQLLATTHSPFVVDGFDPADVRVMRLDEKGHATCQKLTDHPDWERWKDTMKAGEFWSFVGEEWMFG